MGQGQKRPGQRGHIDRHQFGNQGPIPSDEQRGQKQQQKECCEENFSFELETDPSLFDSGRTFFSGTPPKGINQRAYRKKRENDYARPSKPTQAVARNRTVKIPFEQLSEDEPEDQRLPRKAPPPHAVTESTENNHHKQIGRIAIRAERADKHKG